MRVDICLHPENRSRSRIYKIRKILRRRDFRSPTFSSSPVNRVNPIILLTIHKIRKIKKQPSMEGFLILKIVSSLVNPAHILLILLISCKSCKSCLILQILLNFAMHNLTVATSLTQNRLFFIAKSPTFPHTHIFPPSQPPKYSKHTPPLKPLIHRMSADSTTFARHAYPAGLPLLQSA